ncbi:hypothetical protein N0V95_002866 [Ascochyta clinopodiicola]|nr:hypothetical protein N0V95_002866 [Ascochyta clinopodiicola]
MIDQHITDRHSVELAAAMQTHTHDINDGSEALQSTLTQMRQVIQQFKEDDHELAAHGPITFGVVQKPTDLANSFSYITETVSTITPKLDRTQREFLTKPVAEFVADSSNLRQQLKDKATSSATEQSGTIKSLHKRVKETKTDMLQLEQEAVTANQRVEKLEQQVSGMKNMYKQKSTEVSSNQNAFIEHLDKELKARQEGLRNLRSTIETTRKDQDFTKQRDYAQIAHLRPVYCGNGRP